jgi:hypothetical protein
MFFQSMKDLVVILEIIFLKARNQSSILLEIIFPIDNEEKASYFLDLFLSIEITRPI